LSGILASLGLAALAVGVSAGFARAFDEPLPIDEGRGFASDPTVGTLPIRVGAVDDVPGPDQVLYLYGSNERLRAVLGSMRLSYAPGECSVGVWALPGGEAWVELHGAFDVRWENSRDLAGIELGVGAGFEGGGVLLAVETYIGMSTPSLLETGRSFTLPLERLYHTGLLQRPVVLHGLHRTGARTQVQLIPLLGGLEIRQRML